MSDLRTPPTGPDEGEVGHAPTATGLLLEAYRKESVETGLKPKW